jgi:hypothetical protein
MIFRITMQCFSSAIGCSGSDTARRCGQSYTGTLSVSLPLAQFQVELFSFFFSFTNNPTGETGAVLVDYLAK